MNKPFPPTPLNYRKEVTIEIDGETEEEKEEEKKNELIAEKEELRFEVHPV